jgi:hypothetical protein
VENPKFPEARIVAVAASDSENLHGCVAGKLLTTETVNTNTSVAALLKPRTSMDATKAELFKALLKTQGLNDQQTSELLSDPVALATRMAESYNATLEVAEKQKQETVALSESYAAAQVQLKKHAERITLDRAAQSQKIAAGWKEDKRGQVEKYLMENVFSNESLSPELATFVTDVFTKHPQYASDLEKVSQVSNVVPPVIESIPAVQDISQMASADAESKQAAKRTQMAPSASGSLPTVDPTLIQGIISRVQRH